MRRAVASLALVLGLLPGGLARAEDQAQQQRKAMDSYQRGEELLHEEKWEDAAAEFRKAIKIYPNFVLAHYGLGQSHMALKQFDDAVRAFSASRDAYYKMASRKLNDRMNAIETGQRMVDEYRNLTGVDSRGGTGKGVNERLNVLRDLEQAKRLDDGTPEPPAEISLALAGAWFRSGNLDESEKENKNALKTRPNFGQAHNNLAVIYMMSGRIPEAQAELARAEKSGFTINPMFKAELERRAAAPMGTAGRAHAQEKPPAFPSSVELVTVDVVVKDRKGNPVTGLGPADFTLLEDGRAQKITSFDHISGTAPEDPPPSQGAVATEDRAVAPDTDAAAPLHRTYVIVFDQVHLTSLQAERCRRALSSFLTGALREGRRVRLVAVDGWDIEGTAEEALDALSRLEGRRVPEQGPEALTDYEAMRIDRFDDGPLMLRVMERIAILTTGGRPRDAEGERIRNTTARSLGMRLDESHIKLLARRVYQEAAKRNQATLDAIESVLRDLTAVRGRKSVILCSSALISDPQLPGFHRVVEAASRANAAVYFVDVRGLEGTPGETAEHGTYLPSIDRGIALTSQGLEAAGAEGLAADTGGFTVKNRNDLASGLRQIATETRNYYLLGYSSTRTQNDGKFRKIQVKVARKGVEVRARKGYYPRPLGGVPVASSSSAVPAGAQAHTGRILRPRGPTQSSPTAQYWCSLTATVLGPDTVYCQQSRGCFEQE